MRVRIGPLGLPRLRQRSRAADGPRDGRHDRAGRRRGHGAQGRRLRHLAVLAQRRDLPVVPRRLDVASATTSRSSARATKTVTPSTARRASSSACRSARARSSSCPARSTTRSCPHLLALSDVASTGHHAAVSAHVGPGDVVVVVGDGAVGLSRRARGVASRRLPHHRDEPSRRPAGGRPRVRRDRHHRGARRGCDRRIARTARRRTGRRGPRMRRNQGVDGAGPRIGARRRPGRVRRRARRAARSCTSASSSTATSRSAAAWRPRAPTSRSCCPRC